MTEKEPAKKVAAPPRETAVEEQTVSKADVKRSALADEFEALKAAGDTDSDRFAELKKQLADN